MPSKGKPAAGGGRWIDVAPERLDRWFRGFHTRHRAVSAEWTADGASVWGEDGALADCRLPYGWPDGAPSPEPGQELEPDPEAESELDPAVRAAVDRLAAAAAQPIRVGLLLARRGAYGVAVADGRTLVSSKVARRYVQGRTAAGGWSQQRFARRRDNQAKQSAQSAADLASRLLLPEVDGLTAVVLGGDRKAVDDVLADRRLGPLVALVGGWFLDVPEPRHTVLAQAVELARMARIRIVD
ncbi:MAG: acVLRF1 family peptidyl-tRNA hydrolase [Micromonosporaceae bacterium]